MSGFDTLNAALELTAGYKGKWFHGVVVSNSDPLNIDRVQASVPGLYDPDLGAIPWAGPFKYTPFGSGPEWGVYGVPEVGSDVVILLQDGDPHYPVYYSLQCHPNAEFPSGNSWGFVDPYGNKLKIERNKTVTFQASAGVTFTISPSGNLSVTVAGTTSINSTGDVNITAPTTTINGNAVVTGDLAVGGSMTNAGVNTGSTHTHPGVQPGSGNTGGPQ